LLFAGSGNAAVYPFINSSAFANCALAVVEDRMQIGNKTNYDCNALQLHSTIKQ
jgi:hypothetical protein